MMVSTMDRGRIACLLPPPPHPHFFSSVRSGLHHPPLSSFLPLPPTTPWCISYVKVNCVKSNVVQVFLCFYQMTTRDPKRLNNFLEAMFLVTGSWDPDLQHGLMFYCSTTWDSDSTIFQTGSFKPTNEGRKINKIKNNNSNEIKK